VQDPYVEAVSAMGVAAGLLGGYVVHSWDVRPGFVVRLWQRTANTASIQRPYSIGVRTTGRNGGETRIDVSEGGVGLSQGAIEDCGVVLEADPGTLVLIA